MEISYRPPSLLGSELLLSNRCGSPRGSWGFGALVDDTYCCYRGRIKLNDIDFSQEYCDRIKMKGRFENLLAMSLSLLIVHVRKIMKKLIVTLLVINITLISCANGQIEKKDVDIKAIKSGLGYWETKDCKEPATNALTNPLKIKGVFSCNGYLASSPSAFAFGLNAAPPCASICSMVSEAFACGFSGLAKRAPVIFSTFSFIR